MLKELQKCFSQLTKNSFIVILGGLILAYVLYTCNGKVSNCQEWVMMKDKWHCNEPVKC